MSQKPVSCHIICAMVSGTHMYARMVISSKELKFKIKPMRQWQYSRPENLSPNTTFDPYVIRSFRQFLLKTFDWTVFKDDQVKVKKRF